MIAKISVAGPSGCVRRVHIDSAVYGAIVRLRYRRYLFKRGLPYSLLREVTTREGLRKLAVIIANQRRTA